MTTTTPLEVLILEAVTRGVENELARQFDETIAHGALGPIPGLYRAVEAAVENYLDSYDFDMLLPPLIERGIAQGFENLFSDTGDSLGDMVERASRRA